MQILRSVHELSTIGPAYLAIGVFDGVHLGHQAVIARALEDSRREPDGVAVAVTFDPHPLRVLRPGTAPRLLTSTRHKAAIIEQAGVQRLLQLRFDAEFAATAPEDFIVGLASAARPLREVCVGFGWSFGRGREGNLDLLTRLGARLGFAVVGLPPVTVGGEVASSTLIRTAVERGDLEMAARFLGREFTILGTVIRGRQLGRALGFPTANLSAHNEQFPPNGVYAAEAVIGGATYPGVVNLGQRPTVEQPGGERLLELHLFDFDRDIYAEEVEVRFRGFLRGEQKFGSLDELRAQIARDAAEAAQIFRRNDRIEQN